MTASTRFGPSADLVQAREIIAEVNQAGGTYHHLDFGDGLVIDGNWDMAKYLSHYHLPERLDGVRVLDVGSASGFFAFEAHRRGANVTAIDVWPEPNLLTRLTKAFDLDIRYVSRDLYGLDPSFGQFDLVICGTLLLHLPDPVGALRAIRKVTRGRLVLATLTTADSATNPAPVCQFIGAKASNGKHWTYWSLSAAALTRMLLAADFARVDNIEHFTLATEPGRPKQFAMPHVAMSAWV